MPSINGLETPPATPELELDERLMRLALKYRGDGSIPQAFPGVLSAPAPSQSRNQTLVSGSGSATSRPPAHSQDPPRGSSMAPADTVGPASASVSTPATAAITALLLSGARAALADAESALAGADASLGFHGRTARSITTAQPGGWTGPADGGDDKDNDDDEGRRSFHLFPLLPPELRIRVWELSFEPRVVELHTRRLHYADDFRHGGTLKWQSQCANPAALSVSAEARDAALRRYTVAIPLAPTRPDAARLQAGDSVADLYHRLYLSPGYDTVALLGELDLRRLKSLLGVIRAQDPTGRGVRRLGVSAGCFKHQGGGPTLTMYGRTVFSDLEELVLFMYSERTPPEGWSQGWCVLEDCDDKDFFRRWEMAGGSQLRAPGGGWMKVGRKELCVMDLLFMEKRGVASGLMVRPSISRT